MFRLFLSSIATGPCCYVAEIVIVTMDPEYFVVFVWERLVFGITLDLFRGGGNEPKMPGYHMQGSWTPHPKYFQNKVLGL